MDEQTKFQQKIDGLKKSASEGILTNARPLSHFKHFTKLVKIFCVCGFKHSNFETIKQTVVEVFNIYLIQLNALIEKRGVYRDDAIVVRSHVRECIGTFEKQLTCDQFIAELADMISESSDSLQYLNTSKAYKSHINSIRWEKDRASAYATIDALQQQLALEKIKSSGLETKLQSLQTEVSKILSNDTAHN